MKDYSKIILISGIFLIIAAFFVSNVPISSDTSIISVIFIICLALPCFYAAIIWLGWKNGIILLGILSAYALIIETFAIITGFPYSEFQYNDLIGFKLFGYTPFTVPFAWLPLFLGSLYVASNLKIKDKKLETWQILIVSTILVLLTDIVLDPAAVALKFWIWEDYGAFYGVPLMNFTGWVLSGFLASLISILILKLMKIRITDSKPPALVSSLFLIMAFWTAVNLYLQLIIPALVGMAMIIFILYVSKKRVGCFTSI
ncbi:MAG TPA: bisanhydrobacterioruberin hydratase CruF [Methanobacteriaceae archaeon]|nr:bisanhydrobacterioruberin hydratase CruF [Methanobacteriaceae archaeon]